MHAAVIADDARLLEERPMLVRTVRGLLDEGLEVTWIGPEQTSLFDGEEATIDPPLSAQIEVPTRILPWMRRSRRSAIVNLLQRSMPDLVYAMGETAWEIALDVARAIDRPAALEVWCARRGWDIRPPCFCRRFAARAGKSHHRGQRR